MEGVLSAPHSYIVSLCLLTSRFIPCPRVCRQSPISIFCVFLFLPCYSLGYLRVTHFTLLLLLTANVLLQTAD